MKLIIVESPGKIKKIESYLGSDYKVMASYGHIRDLNKKELSIDKQDSYKPIYSISADKVATVKKIKDIISTNNIKEVLLATDPDREGEAISFHLSKVLNLDNRLQNRITFQEITKNAVLRSLQNPRKIDMDLVYAQEARRVLDRLVGYQVSPILWAKISDMQNLSAGRVQSVALKLIIEREINIKNYKTQSNFKLNIEFLNKRTQILKCKCVKSFDTTEKVLEYLKIIENEKFSITDILQTEVIINAKHPFTTSILQQESNIKLGISIEKTMELAQTLYEQGHITYMRTDSINISEDAIVLAKNYIEKNIGFKYFEKHIFNNKNSHAQEAHEAIRPTYFDNVIVSDNKDEQKLYELIFNRALASQMKGQVKSKNSVLVNKGEFLADTLTVKFDGFTKIYQSINESLDTNSDEEDLQVEASDNEFIVGTELQFNNCAASESILNYPKHFTEASIIKELEKNLIGRPSTYASILKTLYKKEYISTGNFKGGTVPKTIINFDSNFKPTVKKLEHALANEKNVLIPSEISFTLVQFLQLHFSSFMSIDFTRIMEDKLDLIANNKANYLEVVTAFDKSLITESQIVNNSIVSIKKKFDKYVVAQFLSKELIYGYSDDKHYLHYNNKYYTIHEKDFYDKKDGFQDWCLDELKKFLQNDILKDKQINDNVVKEFKKFKVIQDEKGLMFYDGKLKLFVPKWETKDLILKWDEVKADEVYKAQLKYYNSKKKK